MLNPSFTTLFLFQTINYFLQHSPVELKPNPLQKKKEKKRIKIAYKTLPLSSLIQIKPKIIKPPTIVSYPTQLGLRLPQNP